MKKNFLLYGALTLMLYAACTTSPTNAQPAPAWLTSVEQAFPSREWVAVTASGSSQPQAENAAMNALARAFRTDVASLAQASQRFIQIVDNAAGSKSVDFSESQNFSQDVNTTTNVRGLIGVQIDVYRAPDRTVYVNARMNRRECAARYSGMIRENTAIINTLLAAALPIQGTFDAYARLSFAHAIAEVTDNFQNILEVLDPTAANRRPGYGGANAIKTKMLECAALITINVEVETANRNDAVYLGRAVASFFTGRGFKTAEHGSYTLRANIRFETISQNVVSCRYYIDAALENAALENANSTVIFTFTEDDRKAHPNMESEARRLAVRAVETSFKEGKFAQEFDAWLNSLIE